MKHSWPAIVLGAAWPCVSFAQSSVSIGGVIDAGLRHDSGGTSGSISSLGSGNRLPSRVNIIGTEDLGAGLKANFVLETGLSVDTGLAHANPPGAGQGLTFGRTSALSIGHDRMGYVSVGRQYTPLFGLSAGGANDPFGNSWLGGVGTVYNTTTRASNAIAYTYGYTERAMFLPAPRKGLGLAAMYAFPESAAPAPRRSGEQLGFNTSYGDGRWWLGYGQHRIRGSNTTISATAPVSDAPRLKQQTLAFSYEFGFGRLHAGYNWADSGSVLDRRNWHLGATLPVASAHVLRILYGRANDRTAADADFSTFQIGYEYSLSRRSTLYAAYGLLDNSATAQQTLSGALGTYARGSTPRSWIAGIKHNF